MWRAHIGWRAGSVPPRPRWRRLGRWPPALQVRVISNPVAQPDRGYWQIADALAVLAEITPRLVESLLSYSPD
jgi:hypothetical protein